MAALRWAFSAAINRASKSSQQSWIRPLSIPVRLLRLVQLDANLRGFYLETDAGAGELFVHGVAAMNTRNVRSRMAEAAMIAPLLAKTALRRSVTLTVHPPNAFVDAMGAAWIVPAGVASGMTARNGVLEFSRSPTVLAGRVTLFLRTVPSAFRLRLRRAEGAEGQGENSG